MQEKLLHINNSKLLPQDSLQESGEIRHYIAYMDQEIVEILKYLQHPDFSQLVYILSMLHAITYLKSCHYPSYITKRLPLLKQDVPWNLKHLSFVFTPFKLSIKHLKKRKAFLKTFLQTLKDITTLDIPLEVQSHLIALLKKKYAVEVLKLKEHCRLSNPLEDLLLGQIEKDMHLQRKDFLQRYSHGIHGALEDILDISEPFFLLR